LVQAHLLRAIQFITAMIFLKNKLVRFINDYLPLRLSSQDKSFLFSFLVIFFLLIIPAIYFLEKLLGYK